MDYVLMVAGLLAFGVTYIVARNRPSFLLGTAIAWFIANKTTGLVYTAPVGDGVEVFTASRYIHPNPSVDAWLPISSAVFALGFYLVYCAVFRNVPQMSFEDVLSRVAERRRAIQALLGRMNPGPQFDGQVTIVEDGDRVAAGLARQWGSINGLRVVPSPGSDERERRRSEFRDAVQAITGEEGRAIITMRDFEQIANAFNGAIMVHLEDCFDANDPEQRSALHEIVVAFLEGQRVTQELVLRGVRARITFRYQEYRGSQEAQPSREFLDEVVQQLYEISYADWSLVNWMALRELLIGLFHEEYNRAPNKRTLEEMVEAYSLDYWHADEGRRVVELHPPVSETGT